METESRKRVPGRTVVGLVVSDKMDKTVVVVTTNRVRHRKLGKFLTRRFRVMVHDQKNDAAEGDKVLVEESTRPISRHKRWILKKIVEKKQ